MKNLFKLKSIVLLVSVFALSTSFAQDKLPNKEGLIENVTATTYTDAKEATAIVYNDGKSLAKQIYEDGKSLAPDIKEAFKSLASGFNTTVDKLWNILVRQQYVWSICYAILLLITVFAWYKFGKMFNKTVTDKNEVGEIKALNIIYTVALFSLATFGTVHSGENIDKMLTGFINPEFGAVRTIVEFIRN